MEFNKPVSNPMMVGSIELLKAEDTPEHSRLDPPVGTAELAQCKHRTMFPRTGYLLYDDRRFSHAESIL